MRSYPRNSQEAAARIVALVLISDGHVSQSEFDTLERPDASRELGLEPGALPCILQTLCEGLLLGAYVSGLTLAQATGWSDSCRVGFAPTGMQRLFTAHFNSFA